ncbi:MAG: trypsin-like peptidase domain-containing protein [Proteobacteria bacterium]|nr:trypsin-like peptidase domain-containing protein [Pseudomonadota bacterium]
MIGKALRFLAAAFALALASSAAAQSNGASGASSSIDSAERGIVRVVVILDSPEGRMLYGSGSGFVVAPNLVVTAAHVVQAARERPDYGVAIVPPHGSGLLPAHIISYSPLSELALLEFNGGGDDMAPLTISTVEPRTGDTVIALGFPDVDYQGTTGADLLRPQPPSRTSGEIASLRDRAPTGDPIPTVNHTAVISSGSSGGPLVDECGRVIGVNSWHVSGADTRETRGVATRVQQLLQFLDAAGVSPSLAEDRCLSFEERASADRTATINALQTQNRELAGKLETADRLTRIAVVILIGGTLALFVAVCVLGAVLLSRRRTRKLGRSTDISASAEPNIAEPEPFEPHRRRMGVLAVVGGATVAAVLIVAAGVTLLRMHPAAPRDAAGPFTGAVSCSLDRTASQGAVGAADVSFTVSGQMCVNGRTLYAPGPNHLYPRTILSPESHGLDVLTIDPARGEFRRERYPLSDSAFTAARNATSNSSDYSCDDPEARAAVAQRNQMLSHFAQGAPSQRFVWRCEHG